MDKQEAYQILTLLQANYPDSFRGMSKEAANVKVNLWADMFAEEPFEAVAAAAKAYIATDTGGFMPTIGQLKDMLHRMQSPQQMTQMEAWGWLQRPCKTACTVLRKNFKNSLRRYSGRWEAPPSSRNGR